MVLPKDFQKLDLYEILGISEDALERQITKAYRKKALKCHPDKNPNNPKAAEDFHKLSLALEILTDVSARAAYDKVIHSRRAARKRHQELDKKRKKFKEDLESRERATSEQHRSEVDSEKRLQNEIERLRREGSRLVEEQQRLVEEELSKTSLDNSLPKFKVTWDNNVQAKSAYSEEVLRDIFSKHGAVSNVLMSKKKGKALVEFSRLYSTKISEERGFEENTLRVKPLGQKDGAATASGSDAAINSRTEHVGVTNVNGSTSRDRDFESLTMHRLRQAEERKRLIEEMKKQDDLDT